MEPAPPDGRESPTAGRRGKPEDRRAPPCAGSACRPWRLRRSRKGSARSAVLFKKRQNLAGMKPEDFCTLHLNLFLHNRRSTAPLRPKGTPSRLVLEYGRGARFYHGQGSGIQPSKDSVRDLAQGLVQDLVQGRKTAPSSQDAAVLPLPSLEAGCRR